MKNCWSCTSRMMGRRLGAPAEPPPRAMIRLDRPIDRPHHRPAVDRSAVRVRADSITRTTIMSAKNVLTSRRFKGGGRHTNPPDPPGPKLSPRHISGTAAVETYDTRSGYHTHTVPRTPPRAAARLGTRTHGVRRHGPRLRADINVIITPPCILCREIINDEMHRMVRG